MDITADSEGRTLLEGVGDESRGSQHMFVDTDNGGTEVLPIEIIAKKSGRATITVKVTQSDLKGGVWFTVANSEKTVTIDLDITVVKRQP